MRCVVSGGALETAARFLAAATVGARTTLPILSHVLLSAREDGTLKMAATNLTLWLEWTITAEVIEQGSIAVAGREWRSLIADLNTKEVELEAPTELEMAGRMTLRFGGAEYRLPVLPADEFPLPPAETELGEPFFVNGNRLAEALRKVLFAASTDPTMGTFTGVHFRKEQPEQPLDIVATDTHRLSLTRLDEDILPVMNLTLPTAAIKIVLPLMEKAEQVQWRLGQDGTVAEFADEEWRVLITALAGSYANYRRVIPTQFLHQVKMRVDDMLPALRRMTVFRPATRRQPLRVILRLLPDASVMELVAVDLEMGSYEEVGKEIIPIEWLSDNPQPYTVAFQHPYLMEFLSTLRAGEVIASFQEPMQAATWQPAQDERWIYVVMPMHLPGSE